MDISSQRRELDNAKGWALMLVIASACSLVLGSVLYSFGSTEADKQAGLVLFVTAGTCAYALVILLFLLIRGRREIRQYEQQL